MVPGRKHMQACVYVHEAAAPAVTSLIRFLCVILLLDLC